MSSFLIKAWTATGEDEITIIALDAGTEHFIDIVVNLRDPEQLKGLRVWATFAGIEGVNQTPIATLLNHLVDKTVTTEFHRAA